MYYGYVYVCMDVRTYSQLRMDGGGVYGNVRECMGEVEEKPERID